MHEDAGSVEVCVALTTETAKDVVVRIVGSKNNISELVFEGGRERMTAHFPTYMYNSVCTTLVYSTSDTSLNGSVYSVPLVFTV